MKSKESYIATKCKPYYEKECDLPIFQCGLCMKHFDEYILDPINTYEPAINLLQTSSTKNKYGK